MTGSTEPVGILRRACDRCHGQKLSCQRDGNDSSRPCTRCLRADAPCSTSLSQRNRRSRLLPSAMSTPVATPTSLKRLRGRQSGGGNDDGDAARNHLADAPEPRSRAGPVNSDRLNDATNDGLPEAPERSVWPTPGSEAMDWISFDWANGGLNPFSVADFDPSNTTATPDSLGSFADPLYGLQHLGVVTPLTSPAASARDAGDPFFGLGGDAGPTPRPSSVHSISIPSSRTGPSNTSGEASSSQPPQADGQWLQRLVEINMQLFDHANKARANKAGDSDQASESTREDEASSSTIRRPPGFNNFDETIVLSFYLVKALHSLYNPESLKMDEHSSLPVGPPPKLDSGTMLIIFSCYVRMLDLFMDRLGALKSALDTTATPSPTSASSLTATTTPSILPSNIHSSNGSPPGPAPGSGPDAAALLLPTLVACGCPLEGYPVLRLRMTLELVEEVLEVTSALVTPIVHGIGNQSHSAQSSLMPVVSPQALSSREQAAYRIIKEIRVELRRHRRIMVI